MKASRFFALSFVLLMILFGVSSVYSAPFRFISMADSRGVNNGVNDTVLSDIVDLILLEDAEFVLFSGDLVSGSITDSVLTSQLNHWRDVMAPIYISDMFGAKVYAGPGNHEIRSSGSEVVWQSIFSDLPSNGPAGETYMTYSFDYLNSHFVMLNTDRAGNPHTINYNWLANDLASTTADHIYVFGHEPAFPVGPHLGSSLDFFPNQRDAFWQLLADYDVDIYFAGHEHLYNHIEVGGVRQVIVGTCGAPIYSGYGGEFYHYALVTVDGPDVSVEIIDDSGAIRDSFEYTLIDDPAPEIKANDSDGPVTITINDTLSITISLSSGDFAGDNADWWVLVDTPSGWYYYNVSTSWQAGLSVTYQGPLFNLSSSEVLNTDFHT